MWFKKMYAKLIVMFNRNLARAKKVKELVSKRNGGKVDPDEFAALCADHPLVGYWLADSSTRLNIDKDSATIDTIKVLVDKINNLVSSGGTDAGKASWPTNSVDDTAALTDLGAELDKMHGVDSPGRAIVTNPTSQKPKVLYIVSTDSGKKGENGATDDFIEFELQYQKVDLEQESWESKIKGKATGVEKSWIQGHLTNIIKSAGKIKKFADNAFKTIESGGKMANAFASLQKKVEKSSQGEMSTNAYTRAANVGRKLAGQVAVDVVIGSIRAQGVAVSILAACAKQLDNKKNK